jgi:hypothetical protein
MEPVQITPQASQDIAKLAKGVDRAQVALEALKDSRLTPAQVKQLKALLKTVSPTEGAASATKSEAVAELKSVDGHQAVVGKVTVNGQQLDTLLSRGSFSIRRTRQRLVIAILGYRLATRAENRAYVDSLLAKEKDESINGAEDTALITYECWRVFDSEGAVGVVDGRRVRDYDRHWLDYGDPFTGALYVRASAESK